MKKTLLMLTASTILLCGSAEGKERQGFPFSKAERQESRAQKKAIEYLPQDGEQHGWDGSAWNHYADLKFTYTSNNLQETIYYTPGTSDPLMKDVELYDAAGHEIGSETYQYNNNAWHLTNGWREVHTHGPNGRVDASVYEYYDNATQAWIKEEKTVYAYDANGNILSETYQSWFSGAWISEDRFVYIYNGNVIVEGVEETFVGTGWEPEYRYINLVWHNQQEFQLESSIGQEMDNGSWVNEERSTISYGSNGSYVEDYDAWDGGQWVTDGRYTETYDSHGNEINWKYEDYVNNAWQIQDGGEYTHVYDGDKLTETIRKFWNSTDQVMANSEKWMYSNFINYNTGVENTTNAAGFKFYPNPAENVLNISIEGSTYNTAVITDLSGRVVSSSDIRNTQQVQLDLSSLESGIYLLQLNGNNSTAIQRIVKK